MPLSKPQYTTLPYFSDSAALFSCVANEPWAVFLDSGYPHSQQGRYDILAAEPVCTLVTHGELTEINQRGVMTHSTANPFDLVKQQLLAFDIHEASDLPFNGGAIGYFSYDLARRLENLPVVAEDAEGIAEMAVGIYAWAVIVDHAEQHTVLVGHQIDAAKWQALIVQFSQLPPAPQDNAPFQVTSSVQSNMDKSRYSKAFARIKHYLKEGDCYQVNLTQRFSARCLGNPWTAYQTLRELNAAPFSAYFNLPNVQILSSSPERFLRLANGIVETKPIKGTRPRKLDTTEDLEQIQQLISSKKDRAENVMIVDLLRNDISKTCSQVKVPVIFDVETYTTVHHLVSTVTGVLNPNQHALDVLKSCFPGGSITGAPKIRAMEIIEEIEPHRRGIYCGSIGYIGFNGNMDTNIAIRTLVYSNHTIRFWAGGGIVNDSVLDEEYQECFDKAAALLNLLKQFTLS
jgi:para-aminobenzoate synthetase component I